MPGRPFREAGQSGRNAKTTKRNLVVCGETDNPVLSRLKDVTTKFKVTHVLFDLASAGKG